MEKVIGRVTVFEHIPTLEEIEETLGISRKERRKEMNDWTVVAEFINKYKDEEELRKKTWRHITAISAEEAIFMARTLENMHEQHWPANTTWTAEKKKML